MQAFNWECHSIRDQSRKPAWLQMLADKADAIADAGITAVWLPPPCQAISDEARRRRAPANPAGLPLAADSVRTADAPSCLGRIVKTTP